MFTVHVVAVWCICCDGTDILKIDNLWCFTSLVKLQLDNNIIEKIEGLDILVNLIWLGSYQAHITFITYDFA